MRRVVITGLGIISPAGNDLDTFYNNLISGKSFVRKVENFDVQKTFEAFNTVQKSAPIAKYTKG
ncbi:MAG: hypothetical protein NC817_01570, partial [Candidatus Omnitrophica bacterium]|nr:hypothetical protein [Candidatus Omnitrophota bacterium]